MSRFARHLETAKQWTIRTLLSKTAKDLQRCIRAEAGAYVGFEPVVLSDQLEERWSPLGYNVCVTCGYTGWWDGAKGLGERCFDAGHFLGGRRASILLEESNVHPQCEHCNRTGGYPERYTLWMAGVYGVEAIDRLRRLKEVSKQWTREELVQLRINYRDRTKQAIKEMKTG